MSILSGMTNDVADVPLESDYTSKGSKFGVVDSGLYNCFVDMAYIKESPKSGAIAISLTLKEADTEHEIKEDLWIQSGTAKGGKNFYVTKDGQKGYLPGFIAADALAFLTTGEPLAKQATETKVVKVWSGEAREEIPTEVEVLTGVIGKPVIAGVKRVTVDKTAEGSDGKYHPTGEHIDKNEIDKFFRASDRLTTAEIRAGATESTYDKTWTTQFAGVTKDKTTKDIRKAPSAQSQTSAFSGNDQAAASESKPSMFSK